jgi:O-antigen/teichoic acid export membrane protein
MKFLDNLRGDALLNRVLQNSVHLFGSNSLSLVFGIGQSILAARMLGPAGFGLVGIVMSYASTLNGLLSFRMSESVVRYAGAYLEERENEKAAALIKAASAVELAVSAAAFLLVVVTAGLGAARIAKTPGSAWMFVLYSIGLLANFNIETSTGVLQITNRIKTRGTINLIQSVCSATLISAAFLLTLRNLLSVQVALVMVLVAYLLGKAILGLGMFFVAQSQLEGVLGRGWRQAPLSILPSIRELFGFAFSSNLSATAILVFRESELLWVGLFLNSEAAGLYKIAYTIVGFLSLPADPLILSVYPETNRLIVQEAWPRLRSFLRKITALALSYNALLAAGLILSGHWILAVFGAQYDAAYPAMMALLVGLAFNYTLFWNRPVLLSLGLQDFALLAVVAAGIFKTAMAFPLVPRYGNIAEAALLSSYYVISVSFIVGRGLGEVRRREALQGRPLIESRGGPAQQ